MIQQLVQYHIDGPVRIHVRPFFYDSFIDPATKHPNPLIGHKQPLGA